MACLDSLGGQTYGAFHCLVLDNGSELADYEQLRAVFPADDRFELLRSEMNLGFTGGCNHLFEERILPNAALDWVVLLNNDTEVEPDWLEQLLLAARDQQAGLVASKMVHFFDRSVLDNAGHLMLNTGEILPRGAEEPVGTYDQHGLCMGPCGGAALIAVPLLRVLGTFDTFFKTGYEDAEFGLRAFLCGHDTVYAPRAVVYHKISRSINKIRDYQYTLKIQVDVFYTALKLLPWPVLLLNFPFWVFKTIMVTGLNLLFGRWKFLRVYWHALWVVLFEKQEDIRRARSAFFKRHQVRPWWEVQGRLTFFIWLDIRRFFKYFVRREKMVFEKY